MRVWGLLFSRKGAKLSRLIIASDPQPLWITPIGSLISALPLRFTPFLHGPENGPAYAFHAERLSGQFTSASV